MNYQPSISEDNGIKILTQEDRNIYSVGISTGGVAEIRMVANNLERHVTATTIDPEGAEFAKNQVSKLGLLHQIHIKIEDVTKSLPYRNEHFDYIYARLVLHYLPRSALQCALKELHRILKIDGKLFVVIRSVDCLEAHSKNSTFDSDTGLTTYFSDGNSYSRYFHSEESIQCYLKSAGFSIKHIDSYNEQLCIDFQRTKLSKQIDTLIEVLAIPKQLLIG